MAKHLGKNVHPGIERYFGCNRLFIFGCVTKMNNCNSCQEYDIIPGILNVETISVTVYKFDDYHYALMRVVVHIILVLCDIEFYKHIICNLNGHNTL